MIYKPFLNMLYLVFLFWTQSLTIITSSTSLINETKDIVALVHLGYYKITVESVDYK